MATTVGSAKTVVNISVCSPLPYHCGHASVGACGSNITSKFINYGLANGAPVYADGTVSLFYTQGDPCGVNGAYSTTLNFYCAFGAASTTILSVETDPDDCHIEFAILSPEVCEVSEIQCAFTDETTGDFYDLAPLQMDEGNWEISLQDETYILNVCRPIVQTALLQETSCASSAGACVFQFPNIARTLAYPAAPTCCDDAGNIMLNMTGGPCDSDPDEEITVMIHLICDPSGLGKPLLTYNDNNCYYDFDWATSAACPVEPEFGSNCQVVDPVTDHLFDLTSLMRPGQDYNVTTPQYTYFIALCGLANASCAGANDSNAAACQTPSSGSGNTYSLGGASSSLEIDDGILTLTYEDGTLCHGVYNRSTTIVFVCNASASGAAGPTFLDERSDCNYAFEWQTLLACPPELDPIECTVDDNAGHTFDFSDLAAAQTNYEVEGDDGLIYQLSICQALTISADLSLCSPLAAACSVADGPSNDVVFEANLGVASAPQFDPDSGDLFIEYTNGTVPCNSTFWVTHIDFICPAAGQPDSDPIFIERDADDCIIFFEWQTSLACVSNSSNGSQSCSVQDPLSKYVYDLSSAAASVFTVNSTGSVNYTYTLSICNASAATSSACGGAVCQTSTKSSASVNLGSQNQSELVFMQDGALSLTYTGGSSCGTNKSNHSTVILLKCNQTAGLGSPVFSYATGNCTFVFTWATSLACHPKIMPCSVSWNSPNWFRYFDLSPLMRTSSNWVVDDSREGGKYTYEINVCRPLVPDGNQTCSPLSGGCQLINGQPSMDLGFPSSPTYNAPSGHLYLQYTNGTPCHSGSFQRSTMIEFVCATDTSGKPVPGSLGTPKFLYEVENCTYAFQWVTSYACPLQVVKGSGNCSVTNPETGETINLWPLHNATQYVTTSQYSYQLALCTSLPANGLCTTTNATTSACQTSLSSNVSVPIGLLNRNLTFVDGVVKLQYTGGAPCHNGVNRTTEIVFTCDPSVPVGQAAFVGETQHCLYSFTWATSLVCSNVTRYECTAVDTSTNQMYDLSQLSLSDRNWLATSANDTNSTAFYLNICRSLVQSGTSITFPSNSGAYDTVAGLSLGQQISAPVFADGVLSVFYSNGDICPTNKSTTISARIDFVCANQAGNVGHPVYHYSNTNCLYKFAWTSVVACPEGTTTTTPVTPWTGPSTTLPDLDVTACSVVNPLTGQLVDLSSLANATFVATGTAGNVSVTLAVCSSLPGVCGNQTDSAACAVSNNTSLGRYVNPLVFDSGELSLTYSEGSTCLTDTTQTYSTTIFFTCDPVPAPVGNVVGGVPQFRGVEGCTYVFEWATREACERAPDFECVAVSPSGLVFDLSSLTAMGDDNNWGVSDTNTGSMILNVCGPLTQFPSTSPCSGAGACLSLAGTTIPLGMSNSPPVASDEGFIVLTYDPPPAGLSYGSWCQSAASPSVQITFFCRYGDDGEPIFVANSQDCVTQIIWYTSAACPINSTVGSNCAVLDAVSGNTYNLISLAGRVISVKNPDTQDVYNASICRQPASGSTWGACLSQNANAGACMSPASTGAPLVVGVINDNLTVSQGALQLIYPSTTPCPAGGGATYTTVLEFICDPTQTQRVTSTFDDFDSETCTAYVAVTTSIACAARPVRCTANDYQGNMYDLSDLRLDSGNWQVMNTSGVDYVINVCRPLVVQPGSALDGCAVDSSVCIVNASSKTMTSGGLPASPTFSATNALQLVYSHGDTTSCPSGRQTVINLVCGSTINTPYPLGQPYLTSTTACLTTLTWTSSAACKVVAYSPGHCWVTDSFTGHTYNLTGLAPQNVSNSGFIYTVSPCSNAVTCGQSQVGVCQTDSSGTPYRLGVFDYLKFDVSELSSSYSQGDACHIQFNRSAIITFTCSSSESGPVQFVDESDDCVYTFVWPTSRACTTPQSTQCFAVNPSTGISYDFQTLTTTQAYNAGSHLGGTLFVNLCQGVQQKGCDPGAAVCLLFSNGSAVTLGRYDHVITSASANTTLFQYMDGQTYPGTNKLYSTNITLTCLTNAKNGQPIFQGCNSASASCAFTWQTCHACDSGCETVGPTPSPPPPSPPSHSESSGSKAGIAFGVILAVMLVVVVLVVLRNPKHRQRILQAIKRSPAAPTFKYQKFSNEDSLLIDSESSAPKMLTSRGPILLESDDDSDEELLPLARGTALDKRAADSAEPARPQQSAPQPARAPDASLLMFDDDDDEALF
eukprot:m.908301 g.908301  ORF g.908301 m.908301 type:complete len:2204 (+) comp60100_c0_seq3:1210-7821(+)